VSTARQVLDEPGLPEIDPAGELADDHEVQPLHQLALQAGGVGQRLEADGGAQVGEHPHAGPQAQQPGLRPLVPGRVLPLRSAHRAHQHRLGGPGGGQGLVGERRAQLVEADPPERPLVEGQLRRDLFRHAPHLRRHFGPDAVAGKQQEVGHDGARGWLRLEATS
jgi:hypothetical protein